MVQTCRTVCSELSIMLYGSLRAQFFCLDTIFQVQASIAATNISLVEKLRLPFRGQSFNERGDKALLQKIVTSFTGLKEMASILEWEETSV